MRGRGRRRLAIAVTIAVGQSVDPPSSQSAPTNWSPAELPPASAPPTPGVPLGPETARRHRRTNGWNSSWPDGGGGGGGGARHFDGSRRSLQPNISSSSICLPADTSPVYIALGMPKTGTTSLQLFLKCIGLTSAHWLCRDKSPSSNTNCK